MVESALLVTFYSFTLAIIIFLSTKFLDQNERIREFLISNYDMFKGDKETYENLKDGVIGQIWILIPIILSIILNIHLLITTVFGGWDNLGWMNYLLMFLVIGGLALIFVQPLINNYVTVEAGYTGDVNKWLNFGKKNKN